MNRLAELEDELLILQQRLDWLGVRSTGADRHIQRIAEIKAEIREIKQGV